MTTDDNVAPLSRADAVLAATFPGPGRPFVNPLATFLEDLLSRVCTTCSTPTVGGVEDGISVLVLGHEPNCPNRTSGERVVEAAVQGVFGTLITEGNDG